MNESSGKDPIVLDSGAPGNNSSGMPKCPPGTPSNINKRSHSSTSSTGSVKQDQKRLNLNDSGAFQRLEKEFSFSPPQSQTLPSYQIAQSQSLNEIFRDTLLSDEAQSMLNEMVLEKTNCVLHDLIGNVINNIVEEKIAQKVQEISNAYEEKYCFLLGCVDSLKTMLQEANNKIDHLEQYSRRHSVRITNNIPESRDEDTDALVVDIANEVLDVHISPKDIVRSHRVGKPSRKPRPIIAKFYAYKVKKDMVRASGRSIMHESPHARSVHVSEDLTKSRYAMLRKAQDLKNNSLIKDCWTTDGNIFIKDWSGLTKTFSDCEKFSIYEDNLRADPPRSLATVVSQHGPRTVEQSGRTGPRYAYGYRPRGHHKWKPQPTRRR